MTEKMKRFLAILVSVLLIIGTMPFALAAGTTSYLFSDFFGFEASIIHEPTADEPYVEVENAINEKYQWYEVVFENSVEITDKNANPYNPYADADCTEASYDSNIGWTPARETLIEEDGEDYCYIEFFTVELKAGDILRLEADGKFASYIALEDFETGAWFMTETFGTEDESVTINIEEDGNYTLYSWCYDTLTLKAYLNGEEITDSNAEAVEWTYDVSYYDEEKGWCVDADDSYYEFFEIELEAGDVLIVKVNGFVDGPVWLNDYEIGDYVFAERTNKINDIYCLYIENDGNYLLNMWGIGPLSVKAEKCTPIFKPLENETSATLGEFEAGKYYCCEVKCIDGQTLMSAIFRVPFSITTQPTELEPTVEHNCKAGATYQWYNVDVKSYEITDENAVKVDNGLGYAEYDADKGWFGLEYAEDCYDYCTVELKAGDILDISVDGSTLDDEWWISVFEYNLEYGESLEVDGDTASFTAIFDGEYTVYLDYVSEDTTVKVNKNEVTLTAVDGATEDTIYPEQEGTYTCEVVFADGTNEFSDKVKLSAVKKSETVLLGDVDFSGKFEAADARLALRAAVKLDELDEKAFFVADVTGNGNLEAADARLILRAAVRLEDTSDWLVEYTK